MSKASRGTVVAISEATPTATTIKPVVVEAVRQHLSQVVLDHGEEDREQRHHHAHIDERLKACVAADQRVDGEQCEADRGRASRCGFWWRPATSCAGRERRI